MQTWGLNHYLGFGKYASRTIKQLLINGKTDYLMWATGSIEWFNLEDEVLDAIKDDLFKSTRTIMSDDNQYYKISSLVDVLGICAYRDAKHKMGLKRMELFSRLTKFEADILIEEMESIYESKKT